MLGNILVTAAFFVVVMLLLLLGMHHHSWLAGDGPRSPEFPELTYRQVTIFFSVYVFFQVWNQINCRSLDPRESGLSRLFHNPQFLLIAALTVVVQVVIVTFGGHLFNVEPLGAVDWLVIAAATASVLVFAEVARRVRLLLSKEGR
jgi:Ca2+-transporting ATPase